MKVIAGIPAYNNRRCIGGFVLGTEEYVDETIVVDCGSTDDTAKMAKDFGATVIKQGNAGEGVAIRKLIEEAKKRDAEILVIIEADCEYNTEDIPKVLAPIMNAEADFVIGSRFIGDEKKENRKKMSFEGMFWARVLNFATNLGAKVKVSDSQSGFLALSRYAMETIRMEAEDDTVKSEMVIKAVEDGIRMEEVGIGTLGPERVKGC